MKNVFKHKNINHVTLRISKGMKNSVISISVSSDVETLIGN